MCACAVRRVRLQSAALQTAVASHRSVTALSEQQAEWRLEQRRLQSQRQRAEAELQAALQSLAVNSYDAQFDSSAEAVHALHRDMQRTVDDGRAEDAAREDWRRLMQGPRLKAHGLLRDLQSLAQSEGKETRLMRERREEALQSTRSLLRSLMKGLAHQSREFGRELEKAEEALSGQLRSCDAQWLLRLEEDAETPLSSALDSEGAAALPINPHWLAGLPSSQRAEVEGERQRWSALWVERLDVEGRRHGHRLDHLRASLQTATASLTLHRKVEWEELEEEREARTAEEEKVDASGDAVSRGGVSTAARRRGSSASKLGVKGSRVAALPLWSTSHERRLRYLHREYSAAGKQRRQLLERLEAEFPAFSLSDLRQRVDLIVHLRFYAEQRSLERAQHAEAKESIAEVTHSPLTL